MITYQKYIDTFFIYLHTDTDKFTLERKTALTKFV